MIAQNLNIHQSCKLIKNTKSLYIEQLKKDKIYLFYHLTLDNEEPLIMFRAIVDVINYEDEEGPWICVSTSKYDPLDYTALLENKDKNATWICRYLV